MKDNKKSYWCSWTAQNRLAFERTELTGQEKADAFVGDLGAQQSRSMLTEENVFGQGGFAYQFAWDTSDLYFMMDDGWDVDFGIHPDTNKDKFGSLIVSEKRFPSTKGKSPAQRLKTLNDMLKKAGWKGLGVWVCAHRCAPDYTREFRKEDIKYWEERILWSKEAGVEYWKVDWGTHEADLTFRKMLTKSAKKLYPALTIEHAVPCPPVNGIKDGLKSDEYGRYEFTRNYEGTIKAIEFAEVLRSYDVTESNMLSTATTFSRLARLLSSAKGYINGEDELYMNAVLGCHSGIMRSGYAPFEDKNHASNKLTEAECFVAWQKISPAFKGKKVNLSCEMLVDNMYFEQKDTWYATIFNKDICQYAPAVIARKTKADCVKVDGEIKPYIAVCKNKKNFALGVFPRVIDGKYFYPQSKINCIVPKGIKVVGIFGEADEITLEFAKEINKAYATALNGGKKVEITDAKNSNKIVLSKEKLFEIFSAPDNSSPAIVIEVE